MNIKYGAIFCMIPVLMLCTLPYSATEETSTECPEYWIEIGHGCYLFAIPEILQMDDSCKVDGN